MEIPAVWYLFCARLAYTNHLAQLYERFGSFETLWQELTESIWSKEGRAPKSWARIAEVKQHLSQYQAIWQQYLDRGMWFVTWTDQDYPQLLRHIYAPPLVLCGYGERSILSKTCVSIVGTRQATDYGQKITAKIIHTLQPYNILFVSGLAYGIDSVVHDTARGLQLPTVGVIAASLLHSNWGGNMQLSRQLTPDQHLFLSETNVDETIHRFHFAKRNRIIAGLSKWTVVVEAPLVSGALITARFARDENREVLVVPHNLEQSQGAGCLALVNDGAQVITALEEIPQLLGLVTFVPAQKPVYQYSNALERSVHLLLQQKLTLEVIASQLQLNSSVLLTVLTDLILKGMVIQNSDGSYWAR